MLGGASRDLELDITQKLAKESEEWEGAESTSKAKYEKGANWNAEGYMDWDRGSYRSRE